MAVDADTLLDEAKCYACVGMSQAQQMRLALLRRISLASNPSNDVTPRNLMVQGAVFLGIGASQADQMELALLAQIAGL